MNTALFGVLSFTSLMQLGFGHALPTKKLQLGNKIITVEVAKTPYERSRGLMFRRHLAKDHGMLFVYKHDQRHGFWMKNTYIPLSIGYFNAKGCLQQVMKMAPMREGQRHFYSYTPKKPYRYALEMNQGWFDKNRIKIGDCLS